MIIHYFRAIASSIIWRGGGADIGSQLSSLLWPALFMNSIDIKISINRSIDRSLGTRFLVLACYAENYSFLQDSRGLGNIGCTDFDIIRLLFEKISRYRLLNDYFL